MQKPDPETAVADTTVFKITEFDAIQFDDDFDPEVGTNYASVFFVDMEKWDAAAANGEHSFEVGYVEHIINIIKRGGRYINTSKKYSFSDTPEWFDFLRPDDMIGKTVVSVDVERG